MKKLGVNIDHVATLRQARREGIPEILDAVREVNLGGGDSITIHLREDRRHINDEDVRRIVGADILPVNLEMSAAPDIVSIACELKPRSACIVPEKREELTTEGGLDAVGALEKLKKITAELASAGIKVSFFIDPVIEQIDAALDCGAAAIEIHTGRYANLGGADKERELDVIREAAGYAQSAGLDVHAGHGLDYDNVSALAAMDEFSEFNIGFSIICNALFEGLRASVARMKSLVG